MRRSALTFAGLLILVAGAALAHAGPGRHTTPFIADEVVDVGVVDVWNNGQNDGSKMMVQIELDEPWLISEAQIYIGYDGVPSNRGNPKLGHFPFKQAYENPVSTHHLTIDLEDDLGFLWGQPYRDLRAPIVAVHADVVILDEFGEVVREEGAWAYGPNTFEGFQWGWWLTYLLAHPRQGHFIDSPVFGLNYDSPTHSGSTGEPGGFSFFPDEEIDFSIGDFYLGTTPAARRVSPVDFWIGAETEDPRVIDVARVLQTLDGDQTDGKIVIDPAVAICFNIEAENLGVTRDDFGGPDFGTSADPVEALLVATVGACNGINGAELAVVSAADAQGNLEAGLNASGIFRKNVSKTEDWAETKQKLDVMPVYLPGLRSNSDPSLCVDANGDGIYDEGEDTLGVPYEEWRLNGDPASEECDPRVDGEACVVTLIECRELAKPIVVTYMEKIDIHDDQVNTDFYDDRFAFDVYTSVSRDDGTTFKRMNVSRMADLSSYDLETGEPFHGTCRGPVQKINDNQILVVWTSTFCKSGNPRYAITLCDDPATDEVEADDPLTEENECAEYCRGNPEQGTEVCEPDYPYDDDYFVTDIWGVRGAQQSVDYDEVDDVAELGIGEIPYSCLWAARGVIVTQKELDAGTFASLIVEDDPTTDNAQCTAENVPYECCTGLGTGECDESKTVEVGEIIWYKPERLTSGRRDAFFNVAGSARGSGFAIAWQEDPGGLRPGKGKGPGQGWSGAITNHKSDIWYSYLTTEDFAIVDENFVPGGPGDDPNGDASFDERPGLGRPKALVPFSLPVRVSDNDMINTDTLKVELSSDCVTPAEGADPVCFPEVAPDETTGVNTFVPLDEAEIENLFCDGPNPVANCCDHDNHDTDPNCEGLEGLHGNLTGTKRYGYLAKVVDDDADGTPDYQYYVDRGGTLDLCDTSGENLEMLELPGTAQHERWYGFANVAEASKLVCVSSDGRLLDGDVFASRPNIQLQPYTKSDGVTKSAWVLLGYEESKGLGHSLAAAEHDADEGDQLVGGGTDDAGQEKPIKQDLGKNLIYHSFDYTQPDLVAPGHVVNLPALCGGLYPTYCDDPKTPDIIETNEENPTCTCEPGQPVPMYFDRYVDNGDGTGEWIPDDTLLLQYRTEIARRVRFIGQGKSKRGPSGTVGTIIYKQGQEGQGRPADVFIRRLVVPPGDSGNPYKFENLECTKYLDETFALPGCPTDGGKGYMCNVWGEAAGDRLCGGTFTDPDGGYLRRDHVNLTSANIDLAVDAGPEDDTPDDPTDDIYGTNKVLLWSQFDHNLGNESFGTLDGLTCDPLAGEVCPGMYSNAKSHRGFIRGDFLATAYGQSPNWAAARNGRDRYNFYTRKSFDGGQTWTTTPATLGGVGIDYCREWRSDPTIPDDDGSGNAPPVFDGFDPECVDFCAPDDLECVVTGVPYGAGVFEPAKKVSQFDNNRETSSDPRVGATPPQPPLDGTTVVNGKLAPTCGTSNGWPANCAFIEDEYVHNIFFVAWGAGDNLKSVGSTTETPEAPPTDVYYTRTEDYGDHYLKIPWVIGGVNSNQGYGETVWRYDYLAHGDPEEQGECQLRATPDGSKMYAIWHSMVAEEEDPDVPLTRWYPWEPEVSFENDIWFRRVIFWPDQLTTP